MRVSDVQNKIIVTLATTLVLALLFLPVPTESLWLRQALDSGHTFLFFLLSFFLYLQLNKTKKNLGTPYVFLVVVLVCVFLSVAIELIQGYSHSVLQRESSVDDLYKDGFGIAAGLALATFTLQGRVRYKLLSLMTVVAFLLLGFYSLLQFSWHSVQKMKALPLVTQFDESWSTSFVHLHNVVMVEVVKRQGATWYRMRFDKAMFPGIEIKEPMSDWQSYEKLRFDVWSSNQSNIILVLRVHDALHNQNYNDRFNQRFVIRPGFNSLFVSLTDIKHGPVHRELDMTSVSGMKLFMVDVNEGVMLDMSNIYFE